MISRCIQSGSITIEEEVIFIQQLLDYLDLICSSWNDILAEAKQVAGNLGFETEFLVKRTRRVKRFYQEPSNTAYHHDDTEKKFEVNIFKVALDHLILQSQSRFKVVEKVFPLSGFHLKTLLHKITKLAN